MHMHARVRVLLYLLDSRIGNTNTFLLFMQHSNMQRIELIIMMMLLYSSLDSLLRQGFLSYDEQPPHTVVLKPFSIMASLVDQNLFALSGLKGNASDISHAMACHLYKPSQFSLHTRESGPDGKQLVGIVESRSLSRFYHIPQ